MSKIKLQSSKPPTMAGEGTEDNNKDSKSGREMMQAVLAKPRKPTMPESPEPARINGVVIGTLADPGENGETMVHFPGIPSGEPLEAISTEDMTGKNPGNEVALGFVEGNPALPIILGLIQKTGNLETPSNEKSPDQNVDVRLDGETLTLNADQEIVLKCGKSSITLTRAGKIIVKGAYLSNHSTGVNRIKGGSVQIN
jgi:hypothetical protein